MSRNRPRYETLSLEALIQAYMDLSEISKNKLGEIEDLNEQQMNLGSDFEGLKIAQLKLEAKLSSRQKAKELTVDERLAELTATVKSLREKNQLYEKINADLEKISEQKYKKITGLEGKESQLLKHTQANLGAMSQAEVLILLGEVEALNEKKQAIINELDNDCDLMEAELEIMEERVELLREEVEDLEAKEQKEEQSVAEEKKPDLDELEKNVQELREDSIVLQSKNRELAKIIAAQDKRIVNLIGPLSVEIKEKEQRRSPSSLSSTAFKSTSAFTEQLSQANKQLKGREVGKRMTSKTAPLKKSL